MATPTYNTPVSLGITKGESAMSDSPTDARTGVPVLAILPTANGRGRTAPPITRRTALTGAAAVAAIAPLPATALSEQSLAGMSAAALRELRERLDQEAGKLAMKSIKIIEILGDAKEIMQALDEKDRRRQERNGLTPNQGKAAQAPDLRIVS